MSFLFDPVDYNDMTAINRPTFQKISFHLPKKMGKQLY